MIWIILLPFAIWALFGNREDGLFGDKNWNPTQSHNLSFAIGWWLRNPFHNLTWHVIGIVGWPFKRYGKYPNDVFAPVEGWNYAVIIFLGFIPLPFISYWSLRLGKFYIGWRERGNFGIKCTGLLSVIILILVILSVFPNLKRLINF